MSSTSEGRQQVAAAHHVVQGQGAHPALEQGFDQERRSAGFEPPGTEQAVAKQQQDGKGIVDLILAEPAVAVVPEADLVPVEARELRREHRVQVGLGIAADGREFRVEGEVDQVVEAGEQADLGELANPRNEAEADVGIAVLDRRVEAAQKVAVGAGDFRVIQGVQDRLVVLVDQHRDSLTRTLVERFQQAGETSRHGDGLANHSGTAFDGSQLIHQVGLQGARLCEVAAAEAQAQDGVPNRPVPVIVNVLPLEQGLVALEQLLAGVEEQALAEAPRPATGSSACPRRAAAGCTRSCRRSSRFSSRISRKV